jgi:membrane fusion protein, multidrug efflux system
MTYKLLSFLFTGYILISCSREQNVKTQSIPSLEVDYLILKENNIATSIQIPGTIIPNEYVDLYTETSGRIASVHFVEGQNVAKGQLLFKLDSDLLEAQLNQILSDLEFAKKDELRKKGLWEAKSISLEEYELSQSRKMNLLAQAEILRVQIDKSRILAPFSGKVGLREVSEGAFVTNNTKLTNIAQTDKVKIEFSIGERYAPRVQVGSYIKFNFASDSVVQTAKIYATSPTIDPQTRMLTVRAEVNSGVTFFPGTFVQIHYEVEKSEQSIMVPATALVPVLNGQKIWKIEQGLAKSQLVQPGIRNKSEVQIFGDIRLGDTIILSGLLSVRENSPVTVKKEMK